MGESQKWAEGLGLSIPAYLKCRHSGITESQALEGLELAYERRGEHPMRTYKDVAGWGYAYAREVEGNKLSTAQATVKEIDADYSNFKEARVKEVESAKNYLDERFSQLLTDIQEFEREYDETLVPFLSVVETDVSSIRDSMANLDDMVGGIKEKVDHAGEKLKSFDDYVKDQETDLDGDIGELYNTFDRIKNNLTEAQDLAKRFAKQVPNSEDFLKHEQMIDEIQENIGIEVGCVKELADKIKTKVWELENKLSAKEVEIDKLLAFNGDKHNFHDRLDKLADNELKVRAQLDLADSQMEQIMEGSKGEMTSVIKRLERDISGFFKRGEEVTDHLDDLGKKYVEMESKINLFAKSYADFQDDIERLEKKLHKKVRINRLTAAYGALATLFSGFLAYLLWFPKV
jgi:chromosome segregation ATPase